MIFTGPTVSAVRNLAGPNEYMRPFIAFISTTYEMQICAPFHQRPYHRSISTSKLRILVTLKCSLFAQPTIIHAHKSDLMPKYCFVRL